MFLTFTNAVLLVGLAAAAVPLVLHLLSRTRYQTVDWGAMIFLDDPEDQRPYTARIGQNLLLLIRMATVALIAIALAQPVLQHWSVEAAAGEPAIRAATRGRLFCTLGAICLTLLLIGCVLAAVSLFRRGRHRWAQVMLLFIAVIVGMSSVALARRAITWHSKLTELRTEAQKSTQVAPASPARVDVALILDCSASMDFEESGHPRFALAQVAARQVLAGLHRGDRAMLLLAGADPLNAELQLTSDLQSIADRIDSAHTTDESANLAGALVQARIALDADGGAARDFYVIADRQALSYRGIDNDFATRWDAAANKAHASERIFSVPVGNTDADNLTVVNVSLTETPMIVLQPATVDVEIHNYSTASRAALPLTVSIDEHEEATTTVNIGAGETTHVLLPIPGGAFATAGAHRLSADIKTVGYRRDDHLDSVVDVIDPVHVLVLSGDDWSPAPGEFRNESDFLKLALAPLATLGRNGRDPFVVDVQPAEKWKAADFQQYAVIVLANVERFDEDEARVLEQYVYEGGGLLVAPGSLSRVDNYNEQLWRDGGGILPAELLDATSAEGDEATNIVGYDAVTPVFQFLHQRPDLMLYPTIGRYYPTSPRSAEAHALAWYTSGSPFIVESESGRGRVLLMTTSLDADWSTLPLSSFYLPFVRSAVRHLAAGGLPSHNLRVGEPIHITADGLRRADIIRPDGLPVDAPAAIGGAAPGELIYDKTSEPGIYRVTPVASDPSASKLTLFAVRGSDVESDLTQVTEARWTQLETDEHVKRIDPTDRPIAAVVAGDRAGVDLSALALLAAVALGMVETIVAARRAPDA
jgi:hypothetical protein